MISTQTNKVTGGAGFRLAMSGKRPVADVNSPGAGDVAGTPAAGGASGGDYMQQELTAGPTRLGQARSGLALLLLLWGAEDDCMFSGTTQLYHPF